MLATPFAASAETAEERDLREVRQGLLAFVQSLEGLATRPELATPLPGTALSVATALGLDGLLRANLGAALTGVGDDLLTNLAPAINTADGFENAVVSDLGSGKTAITLDINQRVDNVAIPMSLDDGVMRFLGGQVAGGLHATLTGSFTFEHDPSEVFPERRFFQTLAPPPAGNPLAIRAWTGTATPALTGNTCTNCSTGIAPFAGLDGYVEVALAGNFATYFTTDLTMRDPNARGRLTNEDHLYTDPGDLFRTDATNAGESVSLALTETVSPVPGHATWTIIPGSGPHGTIGLAPDATSPFDKVAISRGTELQLLSDLSFTEGLTGLAQFASLMAGTEAAAEVDLPFVDTSIDELLDVGDALTDLITGQAQAQIVCGRTDSNPPRGLPRVGEPAFCQATTTEEVTATTTSWSVFGVGTIAGASLDGTVGINPEKNIKLTGFAGFPQLAVSYDSTTAGGGTASRHAISPVVSVQGLAGRFSESGLNGQPRYANSSLLFDIDWNQAAGNLAQPTGSFDALGPPTGLTDLRSRPGGPATLDLALGSRQTHVDFGIALDVKRPLDLATGDPTLPDRYFLGVGAGPEIFIDSIAITPPAATSLPYEGRIGFLGVDVDISSFALSTDAGQKAVSVDLPAPASGAQFIRPDDSPLVISDAIRFSDLVVDASGDPFAAASTTSVSATIDHNMSTTADATVVPQKLGTKDIITLPGTTTVPSGTVLVSWPDLGPRTVPAVVTGGDYDSLRLFDLVPTLTGFVDSVAAGVTNTQFSVSSQDFLRDFGVAASDHVDRTVFNVDKASSCHGFTVVNATTLECDGPLAGALDWEVGDAFTIDGDDTAMRGQLVEGLTGTLQRLESLGGDSHTATLPLVDVRPDELALERSLMLDALGELSRRIGEASILGGVVDGAAGTSTTELSDTKDESNSDAPTNFEFEFAIDPTLGPTNAGRHVEGTLYLVNPTTGAEEAQCEGFLVKDATTLVCDTALSNSKSWTNGGLYRVILVRPPQRETAQGFLPSLLALLSADPDLDGVSPSMGFELSTDELVAELVAGASEALQVPLRIPQDATALISNPVANPANEPISLQTTSATTIKVGIDLDSGVPSVLGGTGGTQTSSVANVNAGPASNTPGQFGPIAATINTASAVAKLDVTVLTRAPAATTLLDDFTDADATTTRTGPATANDCNNGITPNDVCAYLALGASPAIAPVKYSASAADSSGGAGGSTPLLTRPLDWPFLAQGLTYAREALANELDGEVFGTFAPLIGASLDGGLNLARDNEELETYAFDAITALAVVANADLATDVPDIVELALETVAVAGVSATANAADFAYSCAQSVAPTSGGASCTATSKAEDVFDARVKIVLSQAGGPATTELPFDLGLPGLSLSSEDKIDATVDDWELTLVVGVSRELGPYVVVDGDSKLTVHTVAELKAAACSGGNADADLVVAVNTPAAAFAHSNSRCVDGVVGFLPAALYDGAGATPTDKASGLDVVTTVNLHKLDGSTGVLGFAELTGGDLVGTTTLNGSGQVNFLFQTTAADLNMDFPDFGGTFSVGWTGDGTGAGVYTDPAYARLHMDTGAFGDFVNAALKDVKDWLGPFQPVLEAVQQTIPVVSDFSEMVGNGKVTLLTLMSSLGILPPGSSNLIMRLIEVQSLTLASNSLWLPLGEKVGPTTEAGFFTVSQSFVLGKSCSRTTRESTKDDAGKRRTKKTKDNCKDEKKDPKKNDESGVKDKKSRRVDTQAETSVSWSPGGINFPILEDTTLAYDLLLGGDVVLVRFDFGTLTGSAGYTAKFPVAGIGPIALVVSIGGKIDFKGSWAMGYSTRGIRRQISAGGDPDYVAALIEGVFVDDYGSDGKERDEFQVVFTVTVGARVSIGFISGGIDGSVAFTIGLDLNDPNGDGRIYFDEFEIMGKRFECMFNVKGTLGLSVAAVFTLDFGFWSETWKKILWKLDPDIVLFESSPCPIASPRLAQIEGSNLRLNLGNASRRADRRILETQLDERFSVRQLSDTPGACVDAIDDAYSNHYRVQIEAFEIVQVWCVPAGGKIVADGDSGKDVIRLVPAHKVDALGNIVTIDITIPSQITGGSGVDRLQGGDGPDILSGGADDDAIDGGGGDDVLRGDGQNDTLNGQFGNDLLEGGPGDDKLGGGAGADVLRGGIGDDGLTGGLGANPLSLFPFTDPLKIAPLLDGGDLLVGGLGKDNVDGGFGDDIVVGGELFSTRTGCATAAGCATMEVTGVKGADPAVVPLTIAEFTVTVPKVKPPTDVEHAAECVSGVYEAAPAGVLVLDLVTGGPDDDFVYGGNGEDNLRGGPGSDRMCGLNGDDLILGDEEELPGLAPVGGDDEIQGGVGRDTIVGGVGIDHLYGDENDDYIDGGAGADNINGGPGADLLLGAGGGDTIEGEGGHPAVYNAPTAAVVLASGGTTASLGSSDTETGLSIDGSIQNVIACAGRVLVIDGRLDLNDDLLAAGGDDGQAAGYQVRNGEIVDGRDKITKVTGAGLGDFAIIQGQIDINGDGTTGAADDGIVEVPVMVSEHLAGDCILGGDGADILNGGLGGDHVNGQDGDDTVNGGVGRDFLRGSLGNDTLDGGADADLLVGDSGDDLMIGGPGVDRVRGMSGNDRLIGGSSVPASPDTGEDLDSVITLLDGTRTLETVFVPGDELFGGGGDDVLVGDNANLRDLLGGETSPITAPYRGSVGTYVELFDLVNPVADSFGKDKLFGGFGVDWLFGQSGDDLALRGGPDDDIVEGGPGDDTIYGDDGSDLLVGGSSSSGVVSLLRDGTGIADGDDTMHGDQGADAKDGPDLMAGDNARLNPGSPPVLFDVNSTDPLVSGGDTMFGDGYIDTMFGQSGNDTMFGDDVSPIEVMPLASIPPSPPPPPAAGPDYMEGNAGADTMYGHAGDDVMLGGSSTAGVIDDNVGGVGDTMHGGSGTDMMVGDNASVPFAGSAAPIQLFDVATTIHARTPLTSGDDTMSGDEDDDLMFGQGGDDTMFGGDGGDYMEGNDGQDTMSGEVGDDDMIGGGSANDGDGTSTIDGSRVGIGLLDVGESNMFGGAGADWMTGDNARVDRNFTPAPVAIEAMITLFDVETLTTGPSPGTGGGDVMGGDDLGDRMFGQTGDDTMSGGDGGDYMEGNNGQDTMSGDAGDDDMIGGGSANDEFVTPGMSRIDLDRTGEELLDNGELAVHGGLGQDWITGDNAIITRNVPSSAPADIVLFDVATASGSAIDPGTSGGDLIFGDEDADRIFGQGNGSQPADQSDPLDNLDNDGDDIVDEDGPGWLGDVIFGDGTVEAATDGDDYIEGNHGADLIFGGGAEDDLIGGGSATDGVITLLSRSGNSLRDSRDTVHGGSGVDFIAGDNARIDRGGTGTGLTLGTDRSVQLFDVNSLVTATSGGDYLAGNAGADVVFGQGNGAQDATQADPLDGIDNDFDGREDAGSTDYDCDDSFDNDGDTFVDADELGCSDAVDEDVPWAGDTILGNDGEDYLEGNHGADWIFGGGGEDDMIGGGSANDGVIDPNRIGAGLHDTSDVMHGEGEDDVMTGDNARIKRLFAGADWQRLSTADVIDPEPGFGPYDQAIRITDMSVTDEGSDAHGSDHMTGGAGNDEMYGQLGDDFVLGNSGDDALVGDLGQVRANLLGDAPADPAPQLIATNQPGTSATIYENGSLWYEVELYSNDASSNGVGGRDILLGYDGRDTAFGGPGDDVIAGDGDGVNEFADPDFPEFTHISDIDPATADQDMLFGGDDSDAIWGGRDNDILFGGYGEDFLDVRPREAGENPRDPAAWFTYAFPEHYQDVDFIYGGWDRDAMQGDQAANGPDPGDRLADWAGAFNVFYLCPSGYGDHTIIKSGTPSVRSFLQELAEASGAFDSSTAGASGFRDLGFVFNNERGQNSSPPHPDHPGHFTCVGGPVGEPLPSVSIGATDANATEVGDTGTYTVSRTGDTSEALVVNFSAGGTATLDTDYSLSATGSITIAIGALDATMTLTPIDDGDAEGSETAVITLDVDAAYEVGAAGSATVTIEDDEPVVAVVFRAVSEVTADGSITAGDLTSTYASDDDRESVRERRQGNRSVLEHSWTFDVTAAGTATFSIEASHNSTVEDFVVAYSLNGVMWFDMVTVASASDTVQTFVLPAGTAGAVIVRVRDTDRRRGESVRDTVLVDDMFIAVVP